MQKSSIRMRKSGLLFVISAPSGAGKTTLCKRLLDQFEDMKMSVSYTTRPPREGEVNDVDYTFVSERKFMGMIKRGEFAEWAVVHGYMYGTSLKRLRKLSREGYDIILDIDVRGAMQIKKNYENAIYIFILPPSISELRKRLISRGTDTDDVIEKRIKNAKEEISHYREYDYVIINDDLDRAYRELESIVIASRLRASGIDKRWVKDIILR